VNFVIKEKTLTHKKLMHFPSKTPKNICLTYADKMIAYGILRVSVEATHLKHGLRIYGRSYRRLPAVVCHPNIDISVGGYPEDGVHTFTPDTSVNINRTLWRLMGEDSTLRSYSRKKSKFHTA
jgi:hypothetical protein